MDAPQRVLSCAQAGQPALMRRERRHAARAGLAGEIADGWLFAAPVFGGQAESSPLDPQDVRPQVQGYVHVQIAKATLNSLTFPLAGQSGADPVVCRAGAGVGRLLTRHMIRPLNALSALMRRAEAGESGMRARPSGPRDLIDMAPGLQPDDGGARTARANSRNRAMPPSIWPAEGQFAATVSHEVRTPLNGVVGMLDMLRETRLSRASRNWSTWPGIRPHADRPDQQHPGFFQDGSWQADAGTQYLHLPAARSVIDLLEPQASQKGLRLSWQAAGELPACHGRRHAAAPDLA
jgi:signal transduction histidine kinase